jgi:ABC-type glycerol-3-phosphate transport system permease component
MRKANLKKRLLFLLAAVISLLNIAPLLWVALSSFKTRIEIFSTPPVWIPERWQVQNYIDLFQVNVPYLMNSLIVTLVSTLGVLLLSVPAAFGLTAFNFPKKHDLEMWFLSGRMMPPVAAAIPFYLTLRQIKLIDTQAGLIMLYVGVGIPLAVWLIASFMRSIHPAIYEAAKIDGCTWGQIFVRIAVPLASGGIATATIFITIFAWNELLLPLFLTDRFAKTFPVVLTSFQGQTEIAWELMCAGATIQVLPIVVLTLFVQKYIVSGLTGGAVK